MTSESGSGEHGTPPPKVEAVRPISPHSKAVYEAGKALLVSSVEAGRDFCKFMIGVSTGAIPVYIALLKFILPTGFAPTAREALFALAPAGLFLAASVTFVVGFFPQKGVASLDLIEEIERERRQAIQKRRRLALTGFVLFLVALLLGLAVSVIAVQKVSGNA